jgi:hypothetical protein
MSSSLHISLPKLVCENVFIKKVLLEKIDRKWMLKWIKKQKEIYIKNQIYEEAAKWRDIETLFFDTEYCEKFKKEFDELIYYLYENLE